MAGVNKVIILGNLGKDPEVRFMPNGGGVANLTIATSESWKDKQTGSSGRTSLHISSCHGGYQRGTVWSATQVVIWDETGGQCLGKRLQRNAN